MKQPPYIAPDFTLADESSSSHTLNQYRGQWVVVYFYPKDDTPGCTIEACSLRDARDELADLGAAVIGISKDDAGAHEKFKAKHTLNFTLLTDSSGDVIKSYGAWGKRLYGKRAFCVKPSLLIRLVW